MTMATERGTCHIKRHFEKLEDGAVKEIHCCKPQHSLVGRVEPQEETAETDQSHTYKEAGDESEEITEPENPAATILMASRMILAGECHSCRGKACREKVSVEIEVLTNGCARNCRVSKGINSALDADIRDAKQHTLQTCRQTDNNNFLQ